MALFACAFSLLIRAGHQNGHQAPGRGTKVPNTPQGVVPWQAELSTSPKADT